MKTKTAALLIIASSLVLSCKSTQNTEPEKTQIEGITLKDTTCVIDYSFSATLRGVQDVAIFPQVVGRITAINVIEGQRVNKGDILMTIDDVTYKSAYEAALAEVKVIETKVTTAQITLKSKQNLFDRGIISEYQLDLAKNDLAVAKATLGRAKAAARSAENDLSFTKIRSSVDGVVGVIPYKVGTLVGNGNTEPLTTVSDNSKVEAMFSIPENTYLSLFHDVKELNDFPPVSLVTNLGQKYDQPGKIKSMSGIISSTTGAIPVIASFPNPDSYLLSGGSAKVVFSITTPNVITIPRTAMKELQDKLFVFIIRDGKLIQTAVKASRLDNKNWLLEANEDGTYPLQAGDVITSTTNRLTDGLEVEVKNMK